MFNVHMRNGAVLVTDLIKHVIVEECQLNAVEKTVGNSYDFKHVCKRFSLKIIHYLLFSPILI